MLGAPLGRSREDSRANGEDIKNACSQKGLITKCNDDRPASTWPECLIAMRECLIARESIHMGDLPCMGASQSGGSLLAQR
jgi:hypothetical protein